MNSRREAIFVVAQWLETQMFPERMIPDGPDRAFVTDLVYTTVRNYRMLDWVVRRLVAKVPKGEALAALLVGVCQVLLMPDVADYAAVNETVEAAKQTHPVTGKLVNGVLRNLLRKRESLLAELAKASIGIRFSHPDALVARWLERFGQDETIALCKWDNTPAEVYLAYPPGAPEPFVKAPAGKRVETLPGFTEGAFIVQDPATAGAVRLMDVKPGMKVLDAGAAPGGKTIQLAWRMGTPEAGSSQSLIAVDLYEDRLETLRANLTRVKQTWVTVRQADLADDAAYGDLGKLGPFDRILFDAPCSNTGVLRRRPDARWRWTTKRMRRLAETQYTILEKLAGLVAPGGKLVYSTCSLEHDENRRQITKFRKAHPEWVCSGVEERIPTRSGTDGAFACVLERA